MRGTNLPLNRHQCALPRRLLTVTNTTERFTFPCLIGTPLELQSCPFGSFRCEDFPRSSGSSPDRAVSPCVGDVMFEVKGGPPASRRKNILLME
ncbi:hypothetical protein chiPu_0023010 [Chiloscyllium punctatum]|uniref:Uncharacterized protein n=1 Tax=Chiloscyllium punctatum TaxID=137246 RepID=A0A401T8U3_CHIPU|nr:hypothetical protein [Chiloscyllium punctatum]